MKKFIFSISVFLISAPLIAQTNFSGAGTATTPTTTPVTGAPVLDPGNTSAVPPTLDRTSPVNSTGAETVGAGAGTIGTGAPTAIGTGTATGTATGTGFGSGVNTGTGVGTGMGSGTTFGTPSSTPTQAIPPSTGTSQSQSIMNPAGAPTGSGWQGR